MLGCAISATSHSITTIIGANFLIGAGSAMHQMSWACLSEVVPIRMRAVALSLLQASIGPASAFGLLIGMYILTIRLSKVLIYITFAISNSSS
jgi:hypothetical protein